MPNNACGIMRLVEQKYIVIIKIEKFHLVLEIIYKKCEYIFFSKISNFIV